VGVSLILGVPLERGVDQRAFWGLMAVQQYGHPLFKLPYTRYDIAHNKMARAFVEHTPHTHILFLDVDKKHPPDIVQQVEEVWKKNDQAQVVATRDWAAALVAKEVFKVVNQPWFKYQYEGAKPPSAWKNIWTRFSNICRAYGFQVVKDDSIVSPDISECATEWPAYIQSNARRTDTDLVISIPVERQIHQLAFHAFMDLARQGWAFVVSSYKRCDMARQEASEVFMDSPYRELLMLDSDHTHPRDIPVRLLARKAGRADRPVVGGMNYRRSEPYDPCCGWWKKDGRGWETLIHWPNNLLQVDVLGSGSMLISRAAFDKMEKPWWGYDYDPQAPKDYPGVDVWFSRRCNQAGVRMWVDPKVTSPHITDMMVEEKEFRKYLAAHDNNSNIGMKVVYSHRAPRVQRQ